MRILLITWDGRFLPAFFKGELHPWLIGVTTFNFFSPSQFLNDKRV